MTIELPTNILWDDNVKCGYCETMPNQDECTPSNSPEMFEERPTITLISLNKDYAFEELQRLKTLIMSADGYENDLDGLEGFTAYINVTVDEFIMALKPFIQHIAFCEIWGTIIEI